MCGWVGGWVWGGVGIQPEPKVMGRIYIEAVDCDGLLGGGAEIEERTSELGAVGVVFLVGPCLPLVVRERRRRSLPLGERLEWALDPECDLVAMLGDGTVEDRRDRLGRGDSLRGDAGLGVLDREHIVDLGGREGALGVGRVRVPVRPRGLGGNLLRRRCARGHLVADRSAGNLGGRRGRGAVPCQVCKGEWCGGGVSTGAGGTPNAEKRIATRVRRPGHPAFWGLKFDSRRPRRKRRAGWLGIRRCRPS